MSRVLITTPELSLPGGVTGLFNLLKLNENKEIEYFSVNFNTKKWSTLFLPIQYLRFFLKINKYDTIHLNPSMDAKSVYRDLVFCYISKSIFKKKTIIYWHGWQDDFFQKIKSTNFLKKLFLKTFGKADVQLVLAKSFGDEILTICPDCKIILESNVTEKIQLQTPYEITAPKTWRILFISRITPNKGWDIAIKTIEILNKLNSNIQLIIAGDGDSLLNAIKYVEDRQIKNIQFTGYVKGIEKEKLLRDCNVLFFPTCYGEGMPISILEGMMYGLPIISRNVGGIPDHIQNEENGFLTDSVDPNEFAKYIVKLTSNLELYNKIRQKNILKANELFVPERLIHKLNELYK